MCSNISLTSQTSAFLEIWSSEEKAWDDERMLSYHRERTGLFFNRLFRALLVFKGALVAFAIILVFEAIVAIAAFLHSEEMKMECQFSDLNEFWQRTERTRVVTVTEGVNAFFVKQLIEEVGERQCLSYLLWLHRNYSLCTRSLHPSFMLQETLYVVDFRWNYDGTLFHLHCNSEEIFWDCSSNLLLSHQWSTMWCLFWFVHKHYTSQYEALALCFQSVLWLLQAC